MVFSDFRCCRLSRLPAPHADRPVFRGLRRSFRLRERIDLKRKSLVASGWPMVYGKSLSIAARSAITMRSASQCHTGGALAESPLPGASTARSCTRIRISIHCPVDCIDKNVVVVAWATVRSTSRANSAARSCPQRLSVGAARLLTSFQNTLRRKRSMPAIASQRGPSLLYRLTPTWYQRWRRLRKIRHWSGARALRIAGSELSDGSVHPTISSEIAIRLGSGTSRRSPTSRRSKAIG